MTTPTFDDIAFLAEVAGVPVPAHDDSKRARRLRVVKWAHEVGKAATDGLADAETAGKFMVILRAFDARGTNAIDRMTAFVYARNLQDGVAGPLGDVLDVAIKLQRWLRDGDPTLLESALATTMTYQRYGHQEAAARLLQVLTAVA